MIHRDLTLEQAAAGVIDPSTLDPADGERVDELRRENEEILKVHPPEQVLAEVRRRASQGRTNRGLWAAGAVFAMAAGLLLFAIAGSQPVEQTTMKGPARMLVYRVEDGLSRLEPEDDARGGDKLQLAYMPAGAAHGVVLSIDGAGLVTLHHPRTPRESTALQRGTNALDRSFVLDNAPEYERFFLVTSASEIDVSAVLEAAEELANQPDAASAALPLPAELDQHAVLIDKVNP